MTETMTAGGPPTDPFPNLSGDWHLDAEPLEAEETGNREPETVPETGDRGQETRDGARYRLRGYAQHPWKTGLRGAPASARP